MAQLLLLFTFSLLRFFLYGFRLGSRRIGQLYPSACSALLLEVSYCSTAFFQFFSQMCNDGFGSHSLASHPSQLSSSVLAAGGCKGCSLPILQWETVSLSETLKLDYEGMSQGSCNRKFICICKIYNYMICKQWQGSACMEGAAFPSLTS